MKLFALYVLLVILKLSNAIVGLTWILVHIPLMLLAVIFVFLLIHVSKANKKETDFENVLREIALKKKYPNTYKLHK
jgi:hypothetical protein|tara:strand:+ start:36 stop:266 length:231 start_codon:yes stop_codon:yes gene_type:complete